MNPGENDTHRRVARRIINQEPTISRPAFAGRMAKQTSLDPATADDLYDDLTDQDTGEAQGVEPSGEAEADDGSVNTSGDLDITGHYDRVGELYAELGTMDRSLFAIGNQDFTGWYRSRPCSGEWASEGRPFVLGKEFEEMRSGLDRVVYATINYAPARWFMESWDRYQWEQPEADDDTPNRSWQDSDSPTPDYRDLAAYAPFADIDLEDSVKYDRPEGDIPQGEIEDALGRYIDAFTELGGGREHVYALDSVGGAYVMVAPSSTKPIAETFDGEDLDMLFDELTDRLNEWLADTRDDVNDAVPAADGVFEPDELNNKNRLYKAPLSIHSSLDGVVTPIDTEDVEYSFTSLADVDDDLIDTALEWAADFTADHEAAVGSLVANLWPDYYDEADGWTDALQARLDDLHTEQETNRKRENETVDLEPGDIPDDLESTDDIDVLDAAIESIDVKKLARTLAADWDTDPGRDPPRFAASWHTAHKSGTSCYADSDKFVDLKEGKNGGGALKLIARDRGIITHCRRSLTGGDYWTAVNELRKEGYHIPYYEGSDGHHDDVLRLYEQPADDDEKKRQAMREIFSG